MKKVLVTAMAVVFFVGCGVSDKSKVVRSDGSNAIARYSIADALNSQLAKEKLPSDVKFVFGASQGKVVKKGLVSNKKTNGVGKSNEESCQRAFILALVSFADSAKQEGANKVVNLVSYFKKQEFKSTTEYECAIGNLMSGVALKGDIAK
ncbi:excinuclease ABC subunit A [Campylobacter mucosalis]|uniref:Putative excinuclease, ATPase subunit n=1 Tax=Campylobacter mucosalis CCUG 21559 TaxID=1032067 RepID=A0A6G5QJ81_9BACT|nr:excinuclease ABC subunit A [Campylobacter mucosalis]QCD45711.1 putative excinuclease, ATPase subunit [Campylobacter mucosalis CCUG 21559]